MAMPLRCCAGSRQPDLDCDAAYTLGAAEAATIVESVERPPREAADANELAQKSAGSGIAEERAAAAAGVYKALFRSVSAILGGAGFLALFVQSVKLTEVEFSCLGEIRMTAEPQESNVEAVQHGLVSCLRKLDPDAASQVATALFATFFGLMITFIGERLVWQIVKSAFPAIIKMRPKETS